MDADDTRPLDRERAYAALVTLALRRPFEWGTHDCATFAADAVRALSGRSPLAGLGWASALDAARVIEELGGLRAAVTARLGEPVSPLMAGVGDIVLALDPAHEPPREILAVCHGDVLLAPAEGGLGALPLGAGVCAWRSA